MPRRFQFGLLLVSLLLASPRVDATTYATWIMVWHGHDQAWWNANAPDGLKNPVHGQWRTLDWADNTLIEAYLDGLKAAGIEVVIADLTNGWNWLDERCQFIQSLCAKKGLKFCVAENSTGNVATFESHAKDVWRNFAGPEARWHDTYFQYHGKPLIVCYAIRDWYHGYQKSESLFRSRFSLVWASGEDSNVDKWGWQLEPWVGAMPSRDSMFVTPSVRWNPGKPEMWRKSLAWLDYNFALARQSQPQYVIVGSYDDPTERNAWLISDTAQCDRGRQMRDQTGALNSWMYYERVKQWIAGKPAVVPGGVLRDGAYRLVHPGSGAEIGVLTSGATNQGTPGAVLGICAAQKAPAGLFWLYHLGNNHYRIIVLESGLAMSASEKGVEQDWDNIDARQYWRITRLRKGTVQLSNDSKGELLTLEDREIGVPVKLRSPGQGESQQWQLVPTLRL